MPLTYTDVYNAIHTALIGRATGSKVQVSSHENAEMKLLQFLNENIAVGTTSTIREAHASSTAGVNCELFWDTAFTDENYTFTVNGFDAHGKPVLITFVSKTTTKIVVSTLINATIMAMAKSYGLED